LEEIAELRRQAEEAMRKQEHAEDIAAITEKVVEAMKDKLPQIKECPECGKHRWFAPADYKCLDCRENDA
jgi:hypothetical protein